MQKVSKSIKPPKSMDAAKKFCKNLCKKYGYKIDFDDKWKNFYPDWEKCACAGDSIDCARFCNWNYDLLVFAVMHEIGHLQCKSEWARRRTRFAAEFDAWHFAIDLYADTFNQNISIKMARFMMNNLNSYIPDYNTFHLTKDGIHESESTFWCPLKSRVIRH